ncbi:MAG: hypothetical protein JXQ29_07310 [Planctomycetes bacterium]|nr:hypothetical protein [Planctomycetota bacterium]
MIAMFLLLTVVAAVFAPDLPACLDPFVLLLGFAATRIELRRLVLPVLLVAFARGSASLDPTWFHLVLAAGGVGVVVGLRRGFYAARPLNQVWLTFVLGAILEAGAVVPLMVAYPHSGRLALLAGALAVAAPTALAAPVFIFLVDRVLLRPERWRRGLLPRAGG